MIYLPSLKQTKHARFIIFSRNGEHLALQMLLDNNFHHPLPPAPLNGTDGSWSPATLGSHISPQYISYFLYSVQPNHLCTNFVHLFTTSVQTVMFKLPTNSCFSACTTS